jgi:hypothetical protein
MAKAVAKIEDNPLVVPDFMKEYTGQGAEDLSSAALRPPRIKLLQKTSPELDENEDLRSGHYYHDGAAIDLGKELQVIPCYLSEAYFLFGPKMGDGLLARADDGVHWSPPDTDFEVQHKDGSVATWRTANTVAKSKLDQWGSFNPSDPKSPPAATHSINVVCLLPEFMDVGPAIFSFMRSGLKIGKKFSSNVKLSTAPAFGRLFTFSSQTVDGAEGPYLEPRFKPSGFVQDKDLFAAAKEVYEAAKQRGVQVDPLDERSDDDSDTGDY